MGHLSPDLMDKYKQQIKLVVDFFTAESSNSVMFDEIKKICQEKARLEGKANSVGLYEVGFLSTNDFLHYIGNKGLIKEGISLEIIDKVIAILVEENILKPMPSIAKNATGDKYKSSGDYAKFLYERDLILNVIGGWNFIVKKYGDSVLKIENINEQDDHGIGTGFYFAAGDSRIAKYVIITNKHVVEKAKKINVFLEDNTPVLFEKIIPGPNRDLAFIILQAPLDIPILNLYPTPDILSEVITIGYPSIPNTRDAYQISHKGEVNSFVEDYKGNKFFLFSAKTSSGNSGSPIINNFGMVIGIVAQDFFEKEQFFEKGKPSYYAGIPGVEIINSLNELVFGNNLNKPS